jgi:Domain of Unknown Function (DUF748)
VVIQKINFQKARINFHDNSVNPPYTLKINDLNGLLNHLNWPPTHLTTLKLNGLIDDDSKITLQGRLRPRFPLDADLLIALNGLELNRFNTYTTHFSGYAIKRGQLSSDIHLTLQGDALNVNNQMYLNQLTLGEKTKSTTFSDLPVAFAIGLLKDKNGDIRFNVPINGSLSNPQFEVSDVIGQAIKQLLIKAISAPFAWLASFTDSGEIPADTIHFDSGSVQLNVMAQERLRILGKILKDRPEFNLDIQGCADPKTDFVDLNLPVKDRQLRARDMAQRRAVRAKRFLNDEMGIEADRLFLLEPVLSDELTIDQQNTENQATRFTLRP